MEKMRTEKMALIFFEIWVKDNGGCFEDVSKKGVGYDYEVTFRNGKKETYEVKGSQRERGIPDACSSNFDFSKEFPLKADFLFVVCNIKKYRETEDIKTITRYKIPREEIKSGYLIKKESYRFSGGNLKNKTMDRFLEANS
ncbi:MAG: hypothetical protein HZB85_05940 [Deltaproteobacteria bacterium]|nr:hypothetical protein [Deltaproteobacteria bacterium]